MDSGTRIELLQRAEKSLGQADDFFQNAMETGDVRSLAQGMALFVGIFREMTIAELEASPNETGEK